MKIGIIIYSHTGNTLSVAKEIDKRLVELGNIVTIEEIKSSNDDPNVRKIELSKVPDTNKFDAIIFGSPVQAFSLAPIMKKYLEQINTLNEKKIVCFVTQYFPYKWMGGSNAINQMKKLCKSKNVLEAGIINWSNKDREKMINDVIKNIINQFS
jgi:flavodoxin